MATWGIRKNTTLAWPFRYEVVMRFFSGERWQRVDMTITKWGAKNIIRDEKRKAAASPNPVEII